ncbi:MAG TPA: bifunctional diguanylate cyclase/phosphodiesterase [Mycobacteriales bacterium]|nr:bifunctional diguanylate cyclase/phosphodiesterase [Mycobacteriales bacterium]
MKRVLDPIAIAIIHATPEIAMVVDAEQTIVLNPAYDPETGEASEDGTPFPFVHPWDRSRVVQALERVIEGPVGVLSVDARVRAPGGWKAASLRLTALAGLPGAALVHVLTPRDEIETAPPADQVLATVDPTLAGRSCLLSSLDALSASPGSCATLLILGLDRFHLINESLGHAGGDDVLAEMGRRLSETVHAGDLLARIGGDQFAVICEHPDDVDRLAGDLRRAVREPVAAGTSEYVISTSIGTTAVSPERTTLDTVASADAALFLAKQRGRDRTERFDDGLRLAAISSLKRTSELRQALARDQLVVHYQPIVDLETNDIIGCEGLLRWQHPTDGLITAGAFADVAESSGLFAELTPMLLADAARAALTLDDMKVTRGGAPYVAVNISPQQLGDPSLVEHIERVLDEASLAPERLVIEITETAMLTDMDAAILTLRRLRERGVGIALDDFGTGYSSLFYLRSLPVSALKIDRSFVTACLHDHDDLAIVASVVDLALRLGIACVAEGVESEQHASLLHGLGCRAGQGYLWSPAVPIEAVGSTSRPSAAKPQTDGLTRAQILRMHGNGASLHTIAAALNARGSRTAHGRRWQAQAVARIIAHFTYPELDAPTARRNPPV